MQGVAARHDNHGLSTGVGQEGLGCLVLAAWSGALVFRRHGLLLLPALGCRQLYLAMH